MNIKETAVQVHEANAKWWVDIDTGERIERNVPEMLALVHSEVSEALEAHRKDLMDSKLPQYHGFDVELVDAAIRLFDMLGGLSDVLEELPTTPLVPDASLLPANVGECLFNIHKRLGLCYTAIKSSNSNFIVRTINHIEAVQQTHGRHPEQWQEIFEAKMAFNANRVDHTLEHRRSKHGKKI